MCVCVCVCVCVCIVFIYSHPHPLEDCKLLLTVQPHTLTCLAHGEHSVKLWGLSESRNCQSEATEAARTHGNGAQITAG